MDSKNYVAASRMGLPPPRLFMKLIDGRTGGVVNVAYVPTEVGVHFSALTHDVKLSKDNALKLIKGHRLPYRDLNHIQNAINEGYIFRGREPKYLEFVFIDAAGPYRHYLLVLKVARFGQEIWIQTFHRSDEFALRSRIKKKRMLRMHK